MEHGECAKTREALCDSQQELRRLSAQLLAAAEGERQRIALDLHDSLGQSLCAIKHAIEDTAQLLSSGASQEAAEALQMLIPRVQGTLGEVRRISMDLRPSILDDIGILATLGWFFRELEGSFRGIKVEKEFNVQEEWVPAQLKLTIFRILQEATSNVVKYANADRIRVGLKKIGNVLHLSIGDNGMGFELVESSSYCPLNRGLGLLSMKERARLSGGHCEIASTTGQGTRISVSWPLDAASLS
jgi:signal transduction histidine kinase